MSDQRPDIIHEGPAKKYVQIADWVQGNISDGRWPPGHRLPSERDMADDYGVGYLTVRRAMKELRERGLIRSVQGRGTYVEDRKK